MRLLPEDPRAALRLNYLNHSALRSAAVSQTIFKIEMTHFGDDPPERLEFDFLQTVVVIHVEPRELPVENDLVAGRLFARMLPVVLLDEFAHQVVVEQAEIVGPAASPALRLAVVRRRAPEVGLGDLRANGPPARGRRVRYGLALPVGAPAARAAHALHRRIRAVRTAARHKLFRRRRTVRNRVRTRSQALCVRIMFYNNY